MSKYHRNKIGQLVLLSIIPNLAVVLNGLLAVTMRIFSVILISVLFSNSVNCAKILFVANVPAHSHQKVYQKIWRELASRGHETHVFTPNLLKEHNTSTLIQYDLSDVFVDFFTVFTKEKLSRFMEKPTFVSMFQRECIFDEIGIYLSRHVLHHKEFKRLQTFNDKFDVCIIEWFYPTLSYIGHHFKCSLIGLSSDGVRVPGFDSVGNPSHPLLAPDQDLPLQRNMNFFDRLWSGVWAIYGRLYHHFVILPREDAFVKKLFGSNVPYLGDLEKNISMLLVNRNPIFHRPAPDVPTVINYGVMKPQKNQQTIEANLKDFLDKSKNGVVYFSLGSGMNGTMLPKQTLQLIQRTFASLPYDFLWKWEDEFMENKPDNVVIKQWLPQEAVLKHPNVKLFITQGGLQSTEETIAAHKPIIGIPFHSDQTTNVDTCVKYGMGKMLDLKDLTSERLREYILEVLSEPSYTENAKKVDLLINDQPMDGLEKAMWWIEYVIRHNGARHLRSPAADMPWWKYLMLDVIIFVFVTIYFVISVVRKIISAVVKQLFWKAGKKKGD